MPLASVSFQPVSCSATRFMKLDVAVGVAGDDCVSDAADGGVQPLLASVRLFAAQFDLLNLVVVGGGQLMEDSAASPR